MTKYFFCNKFVNEMFLRCNIKNLFGSREIRFLYYVSVLSLIHISLSLWFKAVYYYCIETNGISSYKLAELVGVTQATAWFMHARIDKMCIRDSMR